MQHKTVTESRILFVFQCTCSLWILFNLQKGYVNQNENERGNKEIDGGVEFSQQAMITGNSTD